VVEVKLNDLNAPKFLQRLAGFSTVEKFVQIVGTDKVCRQVKIGSQICHLVSAGIFISWLEQLFIYLWTSPFVSRPLLFPG
jgi:hypothetical protein